MRMRWVLVVPAVCSCGLAAQQTPSLPSFDVASIKPSQILREGGRGGRRERIEAPPGSLIMGSVRFSTLVRWAYDVLDYQVTGPGWINDERYDLSAKAADPVAEPELRKMLQSLLAERFRLTIHRQTREMNAYVIVIGKNGPKMQPSQTQGESSIRPNGVMGVVAERADLREMLSMLSQALQAPVIDQTGLKGRYDFKVDMSPYITPEMLSAKGPPDIAGIAIIALQEQLGLKMESKKVPVEMIIVDRAEKTPVEN